PLHPGERPPHLGPREAEQRPQHGLADCPAGGGTGTGILSAKTTKLKSAMRRDWRLRDGLSLQGAFLCLQKVLGSRIHYSRNATECSLLLLLRPAFRF